MVKDPKYFTDRKMILVENKNVENIELPYEYIKDHYSPKEKAKIVISLLEQIIENGEEWLRDEENYHGDKLAEKGDNQYKEKLEND
jgi:DNA-binding HxlR family transcriptional regulator